jgi:hypothetical protein
MGDTHETAERHTDAPADAHDNHASAPAAAVDETERRRHWYVDEIVVAAFAFLGIAGGVFLPLNYPVPPITASFLLATGLAALAYRYLGGIQGASMTVGALKLGGSLAALVGIALLINQTLAKQAPKPIEVYEVSGQVMDEAGQPVQPLDTKDVAVNPPVYQQLPDGMFKVDIHSSIGVDGKPELPLLSISHDGYDAEPIDLNAKATNTGLTVKRQGQRIDLGRVVLHRPAQPYQPNVTAEPVAPAGSQAGGKGSGGQP